MKKSSIKKYGATIFLNMIVSFLSLHAMDPGTTYDINWAFDQFKQHGVEKGVFYDDAGNKVATKTKADVASTIKKIDKVLKRKLLVTYHPDKMNNDRTAYDALEKAAEQLKNPLEEEKDPKEKLKENIQKQLMGLQADVTSHADAKTSEDKAARLKSIVDYLTTFLKYLTGTDAGLKTAVAEVPKIIETFLTEISHGGWVAFNKGASEAELRTSLGSLKKIGFDADRLRNETTRLTAAVKADLDNETLAIELEQAQKKPELEEILMVLDTDFLALEALTKLAGNSDYNQVFIDMGFFDRFNTIVDYINYLRNSDDRYVHNITDLPKRYAILKGVIDRRERLDEAARTAATAGKSVLEYVVKAYLPMIEATWQDYKDICGMDNDPSGTKALIEKDCAAVWDKLTADVISKINPIIGDERDKIKAVFTNFHTQEDGDIISFEFQEFAKQNNIFKKIFDLLGIKPISDEDRKKAEAEAKQKAVEEARRKAEEDRQAREDKKRAEDSAKKKAEEQAKQSQLLIKSLNDLLDKLNVLNGLLGKFIR